MYIYQIKSFCFSLKHQKSEIMRYFCGKIERNIEASVAMFPTLIHLPSMRREVLIFPVSFCLSPTLLVLLILSLPARSQNEKMDTRAMWGWLASATLQYFKVKIVLSCILKQAQSLKHRLIFLQKVGGKKMIGKEYEKNSSKIVILTLKLFKISLFLTKFSKNLLKR